MSELRWNPLLGEWTATATHRQERTFLPPAEFCPLCPTEPGGFPTEVPASEFEIAVFENRFPSLSPSPPPSDFAGTATAPSRPAVGACEVIVYTSRHDATLADLPTERVESLVRVWMDRTAELGRRPEIAYVFPFENKGEVIGVTLAHPHGQIYAYPFVPPIPARELARMDAHRRATGRCLYCDVLEEERSDGRRIVGTGERFAAFVPSFARYPYELHIAPLAHVRSLTELDDDDVRDFARVLKSTLVAYDALFDRSFPYIMAIHQAPVDGGVHDEAHLHVEFYPPMRSATKLKYLAGSEAGAGMFINDTLAEEKAAEIRAHWRPA